jgi:HD-GYP domain-containing protein (c-di-GMP phosphodiesterase class II)
LHHERPDGHGYPFGLRGNEIPWRRASSHVADAYDAMTSARAYRPARPPSAAVAELRLYSGSLFDLRLRDGPSSKPFAVRPRPRPTWRHARSPA